MEPGPTASNLPDDLRTQERNAFYHSLAPAAQERFLRALERAQESGLSGQRAWEEAVIAAETTYAPDEVADEWPTRTEP